MILTIPATRGAAVALLLVLLAPVPGAAQDPVATGRRVYATALLAAQEYRLGVSGGRIISVPEVEEARLFLGQTSEQAGALPAGLAESVVPLVDRALALVRATAEPDSVDVLVRELGARLERRLGASLEPIPEWTHAMARGQELYVANCASCHGVSGAGNGPAAAGQDPPPANLVDRALLATSSPLDFYRRITLGVAGTSMPAFEGMLSEDERWTVALYASTLRLPAPSGTVPEELRRFGATAAVPDVELLAALGTHGEPDGAALARLAAVRRAGAADRGTRLASAFGSVRAMLDSSIAAAGSGDSRAAASAVLSAYMAFESLEREIRPRSPGLASDLEQGFTGIRLAAEAGTSAADLRQQEAEVVHLLDRAERLLGSDSAPGELFLQSFVLLVREGLEAILIVGALLAFLTRLGATRRIRDVRAGLVAAIFASLLTALLIETVFHLSPASQEALEGITMLAATAVLFSVSYWLLTKLEVGKWSAFVRNRVRSAVEGGSSLALASVAFLAVYREGFETVLFYKALFVSAGAGSTPPILGGMAAGAVVLVVTYVAMQRFGVRLPLKPFFAITSAFLYYMAFTFAGHGVAELQAGGYLPTTVVPGLPRLPRLGVYPTIESTLAQGLLVLLAAGAVLWIFLLEPRRRRRRAPAQVAMLEAVAPVDDLLEAGVAESLERVDAELEELRSEVSRIRHRAEVGGGTGAPVD